MFNQKKIEDLLFEICSNKEIFSFKNIKNASYVKISGTGSVFLSARDNQRFLQIIAELKKDRYINDNFGQDYLKDKILEIIISSIKISKDGLKKEIENKVNEFLQNLHEEIKEHLFIFPVENFILKRKFKVGDVTFYPYTKTKRDYIRSKIWKIIKNNPHYSREENIKNLNQLFSYFETSVSRIKFSLAEVNLYGCKGPVEQVALIKIRMAIHALKLYSYPVDDSHQRYFGIVGEVIRGTIRTNFNFVEGFNQSNKVMGYLVPFEIDTKRKEFMKKFDFNLLNGILEKNTLNDFEQRFLTAVFWFGYAMNIPIFYDELKKHQRQKSGFENIEYFNLNQRFFYLFISIESLLKIKNEKKYTEKVKKRISKLISDDLTEREDIIQRMDRYFKKRGEIAHQGVEFVSLEQVIDMTFIVQFCLFNTLKLLRNRSFEEQSQFIQIIEGF